MRAMIEIEKDDRVLWFVSVPARNKGADLWVVAMQKATTGLFELQGRIRTYVDDKTFSSRDVRLPIHMQALPCTEQEASAAFKQYLEQLVTGMEEPYGFDLVFTDVNGSVDQMLELKEKQAMAEGSMLSRVTITPGRNDPCVCGSGIKFKRCHGKAG